MNKANLNLLIFPLIIIFLFGCATNPITGKKEIKIFSDKDEIKFGKEVYSSVIKEYGTYYDEKQQTLVNTIGHKLIPFAERKLPYSFTLLNTDIINAFAAPGGYIFVTKGLLNYVENENELACVIGHEIGHITARHSMKALEKQYGYEILFTLISIMSGKDLSGLKQYADATKNLILLGYGRENEFQADELGIKYAKLAGYDPKGAITFFQKLQKMEGKKSSGVEKLFASHPPTSDRIKNIEKQINKLP